METFIQPKITDYHQLNKTEVQLINKNKALAEQYNNFATKLHNSPPPNTPIQNNKPPNYIALNQR